MSGSADIPEELYVLAGEYVLGALDLNEMRAVRRQAMVSEPLAAAIAGWERRLAPMADAVPVVAPPAALWSRIEQVIAPLDDDTEELAPRLTVVPPPPPPPPERAPPPPLQPRVLPPPPEVRRPRAPYMVQRRVWPWKLVSAVSLGLAAGIVGIVLVPSLALRLDVPELSARFSPRVAALMPMDTHTPGFLAEARPDGTVVLTALNPVDVPAGKSLELWILPPGAAAPKSLGVLSPEGVHVTLATMPIAETQLLISLEPQGGSPTGAPTGPVVYGGKLGRRL